MRLEPTWEGIVDEESSYICKESDRKLQSGETSAQQQKNKTNQKQKQRPRVSWARVAGLCNSDANSIVDCSSVVSSNSHTVANFIATCRRRQKEIREVLFSIKMPTPCGAQYGFMPMHKNLHNKGFGWDRSYTSLDLTVTRSPYRDRV